MTPARRLAVVLTSIAAGAAAPAIARADAPEPAAPPITVTLVPAAPKLLLGKDTELAEK